MENEELKTLCLAKLAYEAYREHTGGVSLATLQPIPEYDKLSDPIKGAWAAASSAVESAIQQKKTIISPEMIAQKEAAMLLESGKAQGDARIAVKPSIGRIVLWQGETKRPAIITEVLSEGALVLSVFTGVLGEPVRVAYGVPYGPGRGQWSWPERV